jgi:hypothetical protein
MDNLDPDFTTETIVYGRSASTRDAAKRDPKLLNSRDWDRARPRTSARCRAA